jgi:hypothetical protein
LKKELHGWQITNLHRLILGDVVWRAVLIHLQVVSEEFCFTVLLCVDVEIFQLSFAIKVTVSPARWNINQIFVSENHFRCDQNVQRLAVVKLSEGNIFDGVWELEWRVDIERREKASFSQIVFGISLHDDFEAFGVVPGILQRRVFWEKGSCCLLVVLSLDDARVISELISDSRRIIRSTNTTVNVVSPFMEHLSSLNDVETKSKSKPCRNVVENWLVERIPLGELCGEEFNSRKVSDVVELKFEVDF